MATSPSRRRTARWAGVALIPLLAAPAVVPAADGAVGDRNSNGWAQLNNDIDHVAPTVRPGLARLPDGTLVTAWREPGDSAYVLRTSMIGPDNVVAPPSTLLTWSGINPDMEVLARPDGADIVFIGSDSGAAVPPNAYRVPVDAAGVAGPPGTERYFPGGADTDDFAPFEATRRADGEIVVTQYRGWHAGPVAEGETETPFFNDQPEGTSVAQPSLAAVGDNTYLSYFAFGNGDGERGFYVSRLLPTPQPRIKLPGSWYADSPVAIAGSTTGVLWAAYCTGVTVCDQLVLRDVLGARSVVVPTGEYAAKVTLSPGPAGRMWVAWQSGHSAVSAVRSNKAVTRFGPVRRSAPIYTSGEMAAVAVDGTRGPADVVVNTRNDLWHRRYLPVASAVATPARWKVNRQQKVAFAVRDAGDALAGARVAVAGRSCTTTATGACSVTVPARRTPGSLTATVTRAGYLPATVGLSVVR